MLSQHSGISSLLGTGKQELSMWHASQAVRNGVPSAQRHVTKMAPYVTSYIARKMMNISPI